MNQDRIYVVRNRLTEQYLTHGNGRLAVFWNVKMARRAANREEKRVVMVYTDKGYREPTTMTYDVVALDPNTGSVVH